MERTRLLCSLSVLLLCAVSLPTSRAVDNSNDNKIRLLKEIFGHYRTVVDDDGNQPEEMVSSSGKTRAELFEAAEEMFDHAFTGEMDDILGHFALTAIDSLDTVGLLAISMPEKWLSRFKELVHDIIHEVDFNKDVTVNTFEVTIRVLGGLLGGHVMAEHVARLEETGALDASSSSSSSPASFNVKEKTHSSLSFYHGELLTLAVDIGVRLLPSFRSVTDSNHKELCREHCLAGAGTMLLEFAALSRMTGMQEFEQVARKAMNALISRRSELGLCPGSIDVERGVWLSNMASIGAGSDSFYEYLLKSYVLLGDESYLSAFHRAYDAIENKLQEDHWYYSGHYKSGIKSGDSSGSLKAFWPGLQVLAGEVAAAVESFARFGAVWKRYGMLPEVFYPKSGIGRSQDDYPLRPEFAESNYFLLKATGDRFYLDMGETIMRSLQSHCRVECGFCSVGLLDMRKDDRMDSYFLAETLKYLMLTFQSHPLLDNGNFLFTTEGHILDIDVIRAAPLPSFWYDSDTYRPTPPPSSSSPLSPLAPGMWCTNPHVKSSPVPTRIAALGASLPSLMPSAVGRTKKSASSTSPPTFAPSSKTAPMPSIQLVHSHGVVIVTYPASFGGSYQASVAAFGPAFPTPPSASSQEQPKRQYEEPYPGAYQLNHHDDGKDQHLSLSKMDDERRRREKELEHDCDTTDSNCQARTVEGAEESVRRNSEDGDQSDSDNSVVDASGRHTEYQYEGRLEGVLKLSIPSLGCEELVGDFEGCIVMIERGTCTFAEKVINAQRAGAIAVLIADTNPGQSSPLYLTMTAESEEASMVHIPSALIVQETAEVFSAFVEEQRRDQDVLRLQIELSLQVLVLVDGSLDGLSEAQQRTLMLEVQAMIAQASAP